MSIEARAAAFHRILKALETGSFDDVSDHDLATCDNEQANRRYRQWVAGGRVPLPLHDPEEPVDCSDEVLVRVSTGSGLDGRYRLVIEHDRPFDLESGDLVFIRRQVPRSDPGKRWG